MSLINAVGVPFSKLKENHEQASMRSGRSGHSQESRFECYGFLPGGERYGVAGMDVWFDPGYREHCAVLVKPDGECTGMTLLKEHYFSGVPDAMTASPTGHRILWKIGGELYQWSGPGLDRHAVRINNDMPEKTEVTDAVMRENGLLDMVCSDGVLRRYLCDADALLVQTGGSWAAYCGADSCDGWNSSLQELMLEDPLVNRLVLREDVERVEPTVFSDCGLREIRLPQSLKTIGLQAFANNPGIEKIVIPAGVTDVESGAFLDCTGLHELMIEGDPARTLLWAEDAFSGCSCEKEYLRIRSSSLKNRD